MLFVKKIIKLTQEQYDILENGGTIGEYTGLNPEYIYVISGYIGATGATGATGPEGPSG